MNGVFSSLPAGIFIFVYADDIVLMVAKNTIKALRTKLSQAVKYIHRWSSNAGFELSAEKSTFTHICGSTHRSLTSPITVGSQPIPQRKSVKILGVRIDRSLSFVPHFNEVKSNCRSRLNFIRSIARRHPDSNRHLRIRIAKAVIDTRLTYGIELTCMARATLIEKLTPVYQRAIRTTSGLLPSTPGIAACIEAGVLPFDRLITLTICRRTVSFLEKTTGSSDGVFLLEEANQLLARTTNQVLPSVSTVHWCGARGWNLPKISVDLTIKRQFKAGSNPLAVNQTFIDLIRHRYKNHSIRYSDGSVSQGRTGIGACGPEMSICHRLPDQCNIFSAEAAAAYVAITTPSSKPIVLFTDSASVVAALDAEYPKHPWIQAIIESAPPNTTVAWIPGHCGIKGNVEADHLASTGRRMSKLTRNVPGPDLITWLKKITWQAWNKDWVDSTGLFIRRVKGEVFRWEDPPDHRFQVALSRLRSGHTRMSHNVAGNGDFHRLCPACQVHQSVEHLICHCPQYQEARDLLGITNCIQNTLSNDPGCSASLLAFLRDTGLYNLL